MESDWSHQRDQIPLISGFISGGLIHPNGGSSLSPEAVNDSYNFSSVIMTF